MISREELQRVADETGLTPNVVEKDYVLGWMLAAIYSVPVFADNWVFKGGTCLKKCYFETYRFSEDLDFTLRNVEHINEDFLKEHFEAACNWLEENVGLEVPVDRLVFDVYKNPRGYMSCEGRVYYQSYFVRGRQNMPKIKLDLSADEVLVLPSAEQAVFHPYSDAPAENITIRSYPYEEVFAEKVRALGERGRPRDLYDVINLYRNDHLPAREVIYDVLRQKCEYKEIGIPAFADMDGYRDDLARNWDPMLRHQLPALPSLDSYWDGLPEFFNWLEGRVHPAAPALGSVSGRAGETVYHPSYGQLNLKTRSGGSLEIIRFAAGNRLCVDLDYTNEAGRRSTRRIEPYSLRRTSEGNILLYSVRVDNGQIRGYRVDRINSVSITDQVFTARFQIELGASGQSPSVTNIGDIRANPPAPIRRLGQPRRSKATSGNSGPKHVYQCPLCNKTFKRKKRDSKLNAHKNKHGMPCSGRRGVYLRTDY